MNHLFLHCRSGFEKECAAEITELAAEVGIYGYSKVKDNSAYVLFITQEADGAMRLQKELRFKHFIFIRQWFITQAPIADLPVKDRVSPLLAVAETFPAVRELVAETVDTNDGKELSGLSKKFTAPEPIAPGSLMLSVPAFKVVPPLYVFAELRARLAVPPFVKAAVPVIPVASVPLIE